MDEKILDLSAQLQTCKTEHEQQVFEIERLKAEIAVIKPQLDALLSSNGDGGKLHADYRQLKAVFHTHLKWAGSRKEPSSYLLLFYAVECGLKYVYLRRNRMASTQQLAESGLLSGNGHDLMKWCKDLKMPASLAGVTVHFRLLSNTSKQYNIGKAHEAWRYGVPIEKSTQDTIVEWLTAVSDWIKLQPEAK